MFRSGFWRGEPISTSNFAFCTTAGWLGYIAKYISKAEPSGMVGDTDALRTREQMSAQQRFLNARKIAAPEIVFRLLGLEMHSPTGVKTLCTNPPGFRRRSLKRIPQLHKPELSADFDNEDDEESPYGDGTIEIYKKRPRSTSSPVSVDFENMLYPDFHRQYDVVTKKKLPEYAVKSGKFWRCLSDRRFESDDDAKYAYLRREPRPVKWSWMLPSRHGERFYYQLLLTKTAWRDEIPSAFIKHPAKNPNGSLREECFLRGLVPDDDEKALVQQQAEHRLFSPEQVETMVADQAVFENIMDLMDFEGGAVDAANDTTHDWSVDPEDMASRDDMRRLAEEIRQSRAHIHRARTSVGSSSLSRFFWNVPFFSFSSEGSCFCNLKVTATQRMWRTQLKGVRFGFELALTSVHYVPFG